MKYTLALGNAFGGIVLHGVFNSAEEAAEYAEANGFAGSEWTVVEIEEKEE